MVYFSAVGLLSLCVVELDSTPWTLCLAVLLGVSECLLSEFFPLAGSGSAGCHSGLRLCVGGVVLWGPVVVDWVGWFVHVRWGGSGMPCVLGRPVSWGGRRCLPGGWMGPVVL